MTALGGIRAWPARAGHPETLPAACARALGRVWFPATLLALGLIVRAWQARGVLLYPDGYQYLLMARGIGDHLRPELQLGRGGSLFVPNADASLKPLFPALIAAVHLAGASWVGAARLVTIASGGVAACLCGVLASRLGPGRIFGVVAALLVLADPLSRYWGAFSSPDGLGQALALGSVLAVMSRRPLLAGVLAGATTFARPELGLLLVAGGVVLTLKPTARNAALSFVSGAFATSAFILVLLRPPIPLLPNEFAAAGAGALVAAGLALLARPAVGVALGLAGLAAVALRSPALVQLVTHDAPVAVPAVVGLILARRTRPAAVVAVAGAALAAVYDVKNGTSTRYTTQLVPLGVLAAATGLGTVARPGRRLVVVAACGAAAVLGLALQAVAPAPRVDMFATIAGELPRTGRPISTAAADAYGFLLYPRPVRVLTSRSHGLVLLDAVARAYEPEIAARGRVVARLAPGVGFQLPDGRVDVRPALLVSGP